MRLTDLKPRWIGVPNWSLPGRPYYIGVTFLCPHCDPNLPEHGPNRRQRLSAMFWPHIDPTGVNAEFPMNFQRNETQWDRWPTTDTFETLTLTPSIDVSAHGHWHGHIINGEIR
jgi:hypothetical protein